MARKAGQAALRAGQALASLFRGGETALIALVAGYAGRQIHNRFMERRRVRLRYREEVARMAAQLRREAEEQAREQLRQAYRDAWLRTYRMELEMLADDIDTFVDDMEEELVEAEKLASNRVNALMDDLNAQFVEGLRHGISGSRRAQLGPAEVHGDGHAHRGAAHVAAGDHRRHVRRWCAVTTERWCGRRSCRPCRKAPRLNLRFGRQRSAQRPT